MKGLFVVSGTAVAGAVLLVSVAGSLLPQSVDVSGSVLIDAPRMEIWELASDFEGAFEDSNPAHRGTAVLSEPGTSLRDGTVARRQNDFRSRRGRVRPQLNKGE